MFCAPLVYETFSANINASSFSNPGSYLINSSTDWGIIKTSETTYYQGNILSDPFPESIPIDFSTESVLLLTKNGGTSGTFKFVSANISSGNITLYTETNQKDPNLSFLTVVIPIQVSLKTSKVHGNIIEKNTFIQYSTSTSSSTAPSVTSDNVSGNNVANNNYVASGGGCFLSWPF